MTTRDKGITLPNLAFQANLAVNVKDAPYLATGDGSTDDSAALQAALAYALSAGKSLYLPAGTYLVSSIGTAGALNITAPITIFGDGYTSVLKLKSGSLGMVIYAYNATPFTGMKLHNFCVDGNNVSTALLDAGLVQVLNIANFHIDKLWVKNGTRTLVPSGINGIAVADTGAGTTSGTISNCLVENCSKGLINWTTNTRNGLISGNICRNASGNGLAPGIQVNGGKNVLVIGNSSYLNQGSGILIGTDGTGAGPEFAIIQGNHIYQNGQGIQEGAGVKLVRGFGAAFGRIIIAENEIYENGVNAADSGIVLIDDQNVLIIGNYIYKNKYAAIALGGTVNSFTGAYIYNNIFENNNQANNASVGIIYALGTISKVVAKHNVFVDNQGTSTMHYPIYTAAGTYTDWDVIDNTVTGNKNIQQMNFDTGTPAVWGASTLTFKGIVQTVDAANNNIALYPVKDLSAVNLSIKALAVKAGGADRASYSKLGAQYRSGGALTALGATVTVFEQESDATWGGPVINTSANIGLLQIVGKAATTINWTYKYNITYS